MKHFLSLLSLSILFLLSHEPTLAQSLSQIEVKRSVYLRREPTTANQPIEKLRVSEKLQLIDPETHDGYFHVRSHNGNEGWVWARNVRLVAINGLPLGTIVTMPAATGVAQHISKSWKKFIPKKSTFKGTEGTCGAKGNASDLDQYILKNRGDVPTSYHDVTFDAIDELPFPGKGEHKKAPRNRRNWLPEHFAITNPYESIPVRVEGYVIVIRDQTKSEPGSGEGTNCGFVRLGNIDAHIALVEKQNDPEPTAIVVEWTPRFTKAHRNWTSKKLKPWIKTGLKVRISGWLMVDPNHFDHIGRYRNTLWEIHPITEIEVEVDGRFVDLDTLP